MNYFGQNLRYLRASMSLKQGELAEKFNLSNSQISNYEKGASFPPMELAFRLADFFGYGLDALFRQDIRPPEKPPTDGHLRILNTAGSHHGEVEILQEELDVGVSMGATESPPPKAQLARVAEAEKKLYDLMLEIRDLRGG